MVWDWSDYMVHELNVPTAGDLAFCSHRLSADMELYNDIVTPS